MRYCAASAAPLLTCRGRLLVKCSDPSYKPSATAIVSQDCRRRLALPLDWTVAQDKFRAKIFPTLVWAALRKIGDCFERVLSVGHRSRSAPIERGLMRYLNGNGTWIGMLSLAVFQFNAHFQTPPAATIRIRPRPPAWSCFSFAISPLPLLHPKSLYRVDRRSARSRYQGRQKRCEPERANRAG